MGNFMSCVLICGAMEVVQVVNTNGRVEKLIRPIHAGSPSSTTTRDKFVLLPLSTGSDKVFGDHDDENSGIVSQSCKTKSMIDTTENVTKQEITSSASSSSSSSCNVNHHLPKPSTGTSVPFKVKKEGGVTTLVVSKKYLEQLLSSSSASERDIQASSSVSSSHSSSKASRRSSRSSRVSIWRPALESISEGSRNHGLQF